MSRTRKGGKYKGGNFASQFKQGLSMQSPMFAVAVANEENKLDEDKLPKSELPEEDNETKKYSPIDNLDGKSPQLSELEDIIDKKSDYTYPEFRKKFYEEED